MLKDLYVESFQVFTEFFSLNIFATLIKYFCYRSKKMSLWAELWDAYSRRLSGQSSLRKFTKNLLKNSTHVSSAKIHRFCRFINIYWTKKVIQVIILITLKATYTNNYNNIYIYFYFFIYIYTFYKKNSQFDLINFIIFVPNKK